MSFIFFHSVLFWIRTNKLYHQVLPLNNNIMALYYDYDKALMATIARRQEYFISFRYLYKLLFWKEKWKRDNNLKTNKLKAASVA